MLRPQPILMVAALLLGAALGAVAMLFVRADTSAGTGQGEERRILYWVAPMDPNFRRNEPGRSPMGMELVPVYEGEEPEGSSSFVEIDPRVVNNIGVRTARAQRAEFALTFAAVGYVQPIDENTSVVDVRAPGWIESLRVAAVGDQVALGDALFSIYAPEIATAQSEYLQALRSGRQAMIDASASRLRALGLTQGQIDALAQRGRATLQTSQFSPRSGIVTEMSVREGAYVQPGDQIMTIADLSDIWVRVDVFEDRIANISAGDTVRISTDAQPGRIWTGAVEYIYPTVDPVSRTISVRVRLENADFSLRPGMFVSARIDASPRTGVLTVPREAIIRSGQSDRVIISVGEGRFRPVRIVTGAEANDRVEILSGLEDGENVVVSGQFLIDSEASLQGVMLRMAPPGETAGPAAPSDLPPSPPIAEGTGIVDSLMPGHGMIDISHDPIEALGWPAMSMSFRTLDAVSLDNIAAGDRVRFSLTQSDGNWRISVIEAADAHQVDHESSGQETAETDRPSGDGDGQ
ncbi:MAG: efflux RND transporter periplasmic adaptor subunit [Alphaproteobacteria bacterium]|nr:efflux RND transporter periplasmic adaptor subunit [Alphaproteobacteria bacterium]